MHSHVSKKPSLYSWLTAPVSAVTSRFKSRKVVSDYISGKTTLFDALSMVHGYDGDRFFGGFGLTKNLSCVDLYTLQLRSIQIFRENTYANIIFNRIMTLTINSGLTLEAAPSFDILKKELGVTDEELEEWSANTEALFEAYASDATLVDRKKRNNFGSLQYLAKMTAILSGDCLAIWSLNKMGLPEIELVDGINIRTPVGCSDVDTTKITRGVERDSSGKDIAYWVRSKNENGLYEYRRVMAYSRSGVKRATLIRASKGRIDEVRGIPLLSVLLQSIKAVGNLIDSEERAALINSYIIMAHSSDSSRPHKKDPIESIMKKVKSVPNADGGTNPYSSFGPGVMVRNLAEKERLESFDTKRPNLDAVSFVNTLIKSAIQSLGYSPEVILSDYNSSFSASRQAKNDTNEKVKEDNDYFSEQFNQPFYNQWLIGMILSGKIEAQGFFEALGDKNMWHIKNGWTRAFWRGLPNISVDQKKQFQAYEIAVKHGWMTNSQVAREVGTDFARNVRATKKENGMIADANSPLEEQNNAMASMRNSIDELNDRLEEFAHAS